MIVEYLPKGSPELSAVEECSRQGKDDLLVSKYYPIFTNLKTAELLQTTIGQNAST
jgi:hypothetical protein